MPCTSSEVNGSSSIHSVASVTSSRASARRALLAGGQVARRDILETEQVDTRQRRLEACFIGPAQGTRHGEILQWCQVELDAVAVADVGRVLVIVRAQALDVGAAPGNHAGVRQADAAQDTQQRGLAAAVAAFQQQRLAGFEPEFQVPEQGAIVAHTLQFPGLENKRVTAGIGHGFCVLSVFFRLLGRNHTIASQHCTTTYRRPVARRSQ